MEDEGNAVCWSAHTNVEASPIRKLEELGRDARGHSGMYVRAVSARADADDAVGQ